jgi:glycosyltransferase involved in cell wall biosynthesis
MKPARLGYVLASFPEPSQTFIADEAVSLARFGIQPCILHMRDGDQQVLHRSAADLMSQAPRFRLGQATRMDVARACAWLLVRRPRAVLATLKQAAGAPHRWLALQALPAAVWCLRNGIDGLHAHFADTNLQYAAAISAWSGIPFGVTTHRYDILDDPLPVQHAAALFRAAALVVTISDWNRRHMAARYGLDAARIHIVRCGIDLERFACTARAPGCGGDAFRLLNVGRLVPMKGQDVLLKACARAIADGVPLRLAIIGGGPLEADLRRLAGELGIQGRVEFLGVQPASAVAEHLRQADLFVLSSRSEGLPVACIEAMASGTPLIASRVQGVPELVEHGVNGLLVEPEDIAALGEAIVWAHRHPERLDAMRRAGRATVEERFERASCTQALVDRWSAVCRPSR